jgi:hypothetical protein
MNQQQPQGGMPPIDLKNTEQVFNESGGPLFQQGFIIRKVSKFVTGTPEDMLLNVPVFYDPETYKILPESVPEDIREDLQEYYENKS